MKECSRVETLPIEEDDESARIELEGAARSGDVLVRGRMCAHLVKTAGKSANVKDAFRFDATPTEDVRVENCCRYEASGRLFAFEVEDEQVAYGESEPSKARAECSFVIESEPRFSLRTVFSRLDREGINYAGAVILMPVGCSPPHDVHLPGERTYDPAGRSGDPHASERIGGDCACFQLTVTCAQLVALSLGATLAQLFQIQEAARPMVAKYHGRMTLFDYMIEQIGAAQAHRSPISYPRFVHKAADEKLIDLSDPAHRHTEIFLASWRSGDARPPLAFYRKVMGDELDDGERAVVREIVQEKSDDSLLDLCLARDVSGVATKIRESGFGKEDRLTLHSVFGELASQPPCSNHTFFELFEVALLLLEMNHELFVDSERKLAALVLSPFFELQESMTVGGVQAPEKLARRLLCSVKLKILAAANPLVAVLKLRGQCAQLSESDSAALTVMRPCVDRLMIELGKVASAVTMMKIYPEDESETALYSRLDMRFGAQATVAFQLFRVDAWQQFPKSALAAALDSEAMYFVAIPAVYGVMNALWYAPYKNRSPITMGERGVTRFSSRSSDKAFALVSPEQIRRQSTFRRQMQEAILHGAWSPRTLFWLSCFMDMLFGLVYAVFILSKKCTNEQREGTRGGLCRRQVHRHDVTIGSYVAVSLLATYILAKAVSECQEVAYDGFWVYIKSFWNVCDLTSILCVGLSIGVFPIDRKIVAVEYFSAMAMFCLTIRPLYYASVDRHYGPLMTTIQQMIQELRKFFVVMAIILLAFALAFVTMEWGSDGDPLAFEDFEIADLNGHTQYIGEDQNLFRQNDLWDWCKFMFRSLLGDLDVDIFENLDPVKREISLALYYLYLLFSNVLLLNLLIALMSNVFDQSQETNEIQHRFIRASTMYFFKDPVLPPPLNLVLLPSIISKLFGHFRRTRVAPQPQPETPRDDKQTFVWDDLKESRYALNRENNRRNLFKAVFAKELKIAKDSGRFKVDEDDDGSDASRSSYVPYSTRVHWAFLSAELVDL